MEVNITKISQNGQVVIPAEIRRDAHITPSTKFIVFNEGGNILLKKIRKESLIEDIKLIERVQTSEEQIKKGEFVEADTNMSNEEIYDILTR